MGANLASWLPTLLFVPLVGFALYRRFKRTFGRQALSVGRMAARMVLMTLLSVLLVASIHTEMGAAAAAGGVAVGVALALFGLAHTRYEANAEGKFYTPNGWIGLLVTALFLGRLAARMFTLYLDRAAAAATPPTAAASPFAGLQRSPLTLGIFFLMAAYYIIYYGGVLRKGRTLDLVRPVKPVTPPR